MEKGLHRRIAIVGAGNVGTTYAYALLLSGLASEIVLIDANRAKAEGEAMDLNHAVPFAHPTRVWAGDYPDCAGSAITVLTAGAGQKPGETRLDLVKKNLPSGGRSFRSGEAKSDRYASGRDQSRRCAHASGAEVVGAPSARR